MIDLWRKNPHRSLTLALAAAAVGSWLTSPAALRAQSGTDYNLTGVPSANPRSAGTSAPNRLSPELIQTELARGSHPIENGSATHPYYAYDSDGPMLPAPGAVQAPGILIEGSKTEPDKNTYLILRGQHGPDAGYDYGTHFLYQGHESGSFDPVAKAEKGKITRINLDADSFHRVTLLAEADVDGKALPDIDGSTWYPWSQRLLFTAELGNAGGVWQATADYPSEVIDISGALGRGGYEGIQADSSGQLWILEDSSGAKGTVNKNARQPNSFLFRFIPKSRFDLTLGGKLQVLQVMSIANPGEPIVFHAGAADADILSQDVLDIHTYGNVLDTLWVTIHDTDVDGNTPFDANALAKSKGGTPFKRPENGLFRPGTSFREFYFGETGDTTSATEAGSAYGGFGSVLKLTQTRPFSDTGHLSLVYLCDVAHSGFDNVAFWDRDHIVFVEDAGDGLHGQRNALDSAFLLDVTADHSDPATPAPLRILAQGRDAAATLDSGILAISGNGFQNDGDNEITGLHISDGDAGIGGILGRKIPRPFQDGWRVFYTNQHGDNVTYEILPRPGARGSERNDH